MSIQILLIIIIALAFGLFFLIRRTEQMNAEKKEEIDPAPHNSNNQRKKRTICTQRIIILIASALGMIFMFQFPWLSFHSTRTWGMRFESTLLDLARQTGEGEAFVLFMCFLFLLPLILSLVGNRSRPLRNPVFLI